MLKEIPFSVCRKWDFWLTNCNYSTITFLAEAASSLIKYT
ncbi:Uncharacterised protein [Flavobacterium hibernum]|nr:Uncharacterised protein [Flavobacterium hibernum]